MLTIKLDINGKKIGEINLLKTNKGELEEGEYNVQFWTGRENLVKEFSIAGFDRKAGAFELLKTALKGYCPSLAECTAVDFVGQMNDPI